MCHRLPGAKDAFMGTGSVVSRSMLDHSEMGATCSICVVEAQSLSPSWTSVFTVMRDLPSLIGTAVAVAALRTGRRK